MADPVEVATAARTAIYLEDLDPSTVFCIFLQTAASGPLETSRSPGVRRLIQDKDQRWTFKAVKPMNRKVFPAPVNREPGVPGVSREGPR
jgi:hypothetical protein